MHTARSGLLRGLQERLSRRAQNSPSRPRANLAFSWQKPSGRASRDRIRPRAPFRLYGFTSIRSSILPRTLPLLRAGGRIAVISFHSLEDRIVKRFFQSCERPGEAPALMKLPLRARDLPQPLLRRVGRANKPGAAEVARNPRARSAVLRIAERTEVPVIPATAGIQRLSANDTGSPPLRGRQDTGSQPARGRR